MTLIEQARLIAETTHKTGQEISDKDLSQTLLDFIATFDNMEASGNYLPMDRTVYNLVQQAIDAHQLASHGPGKVMSNASTSLDTLVDKIEAWLDDDDAGGMDTSLFKKIVKAGKDPVVSGS